MLGVCSAVQGHEPSRGSASARRHPISPEGTGGLFAAPPVLPPVLPGAVLCAGNGSRAGYAGTGPVHPARAEGSLGYFGSRLNCAVDQR